MGVIDLPAMTALCSKVERVIALTMELEASVTWDNAPVDFAERAWPAYLAAVEEDTSSALTNFSYRGTLQM